MGSRDGIETSGGMGSRDGIGTSGGMDKREDAGIPPIGGTFSTDSGESRVLIYVYVCGAVCDPGVVVLPAGSRADDAVKAAGGMTQDADRAYVNLAAVVSDGEKVFIPTLEEAKTFYREQVANEAGLININKADLTRLCTLPGIGESRAADIIAYREKNGLFRAIEDIMKVPGIKTSTFSKISDMITVE
jgi:competence protein ComEA